MKNGLNVMSFFDGISCGQYALYKLGVPVAVYYASEIDKFAIQITQKNFPNTVQLGDINKINFADYEEKIDLIMGGSPCQDLSIAGKRAGLKGERSGLFYKFVEAIQTIKPKYFLLENNYNMPQDAYEEISRLMGCYPVLIDSALVSAQSRKRLYWTNVGPQQFNLFGFPTCDIPQPKDKKIILKDILENGVCYQNKAHCLTTRYDRAVFPHDYLKHKKTFVFEPLKVGYIGNVDAQSSRVYSVEGKSATLNALGGGGGAKTGLYKIDLPDGKYIIRKLSPIECERLQTLPDNYTEGVSNTQRYKCIGNGWTIDVITHILSFMEVVA